MNKQNHQGNAIINYSDDSKLYTRIIEHKHFEKVDCPHTILTKEYPETYVKGLTPYYPINNDNNQSLYQKYKDKSKALTNFIFGGRLSEYKYMDMHVVIESAMNKLKSSLKN